jgi:hypothetical protein
MVKDKFVQGKDTYKGANYCKKCHLHHYQQWQTSRHAKATDKPLKGNLIMSDKRCYSCHGKKETKEGVSCEICHGPGYTKVCKDDPQFVEARLCQRCHEMTQPMTKDKMMSTYSEWLVSKAKKEGKTCYTCHMPKTIIMGKSISYHGFYSIRTHPEWGKNKGVKIKEVIKKEDEVIIIIKNQVNGHYMPTGCPSRKIELEIVGYNNEGEIVYDDKFAFQKKVSKFLGMPWKIKSDNRLKDGEERKIIFKIEKNKITKIKTSLWMRKRNCVKFDILLDEYEMKLYKGVNEDV